MNVLGSLGACVYLWVFLLSNAFRFSSPRSGSIHCKRLKPTWEDVATELKGKVRSLRRDELERSEDGYLNVPLPGD